ncbi:hypothetical protein MLD38_027324 [Melastoma candidum]|uniref:Uncharacterized protein n=1 Tax=Melastoma candidum TaxID=119954 RepID=A0ACB9P463_9MYRT|nr:hypothetical protein MLD38_027324 [Melastoma candidum]
MKRKVRKVEVPKETYEETSGVEDSGNLTGMSNEGEGLPYAPEDFPLPGDKWRWRVGKRVSITGYHRDRFLYPPSRLCQGKNSHNKRGFASKVSAERYIRREFPEMDVAAFFASFSWMIPAKRNRSGNCSGERQPSCSVPRRDMVEHAYNGSNDGAIGSSAQNQICISLNLHSGKSNVSSMPCDMSCSMTGVCQNCCILCYKSIDSTNEWYGFIKCESLIDGKLCGHLAHINCALRAHLAGTVGGDIGLDAEYYCRRCDSRTEVISHVRRLMETCKVVDSRDEVEKALNLSIWILQGSQKDTARSLLSHIESVLNKIKSSTPLQEIWTQESIPDVVDYIDFEVGPDAVLDEPVCYDYQIQSLKLDDEINKVLQKLKKSQELEYKIVEDMFNARKNYLQNLYQQLEEESSELARQSLSADFDEFLNVVLNRKEQIRLELKKFKEMKEVAKGFGRTSKSLLKEHFGIDIDP